MRGAVVNIRGEKTIAATPADGQTPTPEASRRVNGMGTGVVIDPRGYIVTNHHVVDGVHEIIVTLADGRRHVAKLLARDLETDLAVIKIDPQSPLPVMPLGTSSDLMAGETVIAVGNAYGYEHTVTRGSSARLHRAVQVSDAQFYNDLIQTDASINPGNTGGPLLNIDGDMIGINVAVRAGRRASASPSPSTRSLAVAVRLLATCNADKTWIGMESSTDASGRQHGMVVGAVEAKSPAAEAGLVAGDVVTAVGDTEIQRPLDFQRAMLDRTPGETLRVTVRRAGNPLSLNLTLGKAPESRALAAQPGWELLGVELKAIPPEEFRRNHQTHYRGGLAVTSVRPAAPPPAKALPPATSWWACTSGKPPPWTTSPTSSSGPISPISIR